MPCPRCRSTATTRRKRRTALGYPRFSCRCCRRRFNERTGTPFNDLQYRRPAKRQGRRPLDLPAHKPATRQARGLADPAILKPEQPARAAEGAQR